MKKIKIIFAALLAVTIFASMLALSACTPTEESGGDGAKEQKLLSLNDLGLKTQTQQPLRQGKQLIPPQGAAITKIFQKAAQFKVGEKYGLCTFDGEVIIPAVYDLLDAAASPIDQSVSSVLFTVQNRVDGKIKKGVIDVFGTTVVEADKNVDQVYVVSEYGVLLDGVTYEWNFERLQPVLNGSLTLSQYGQGIGVPLAEYFMVPVGADFIFIVDRNNVCKAQLDVSDGVFYASSYFIVKQTQRELPFDAQQYDYFENGSKYAMDTIVYDLKSGSERKVDFPYVLRKASQEYNSFLSKLSFEKGDVINNAVFLDVQEVAKDKTLSKTEVKLFNNTLDLLMEFKHYQAPVKIAENRYIIDSDVIGKILTDENGKQLASMGEAKYYVSDNLIVTYRFNRYGAIDFNGLTAVDFSYDVLEDFYDGAAIGVVDDTVYCVYKDGSHLEIAKSQDVTVIGRGVYYILEGSEHKIKSNKGNDIVVLDSAAKSSFITENGIIIESALGQYYYLS